MAWAGSQGWKSGQPAPVALAYAVAVNWPPEAVTRPDSFCRSAIRTWGLMRQARATAPMMPAAELLLTAGRAAQYSVSGVAGVSTR